ncbi:MAG: hypothetical protein A3C70_02035 [Candidatus Zambryskibacteria bacterium RIFCSPHIGHO2_02_FULL_43_14]|uniref:Peptidase M10 metallopeptidase domain-containing protein n=1 Tax=Candidatus Zambryskibacteria bacterium RIFCSPHIGHO2_02_FULL_43_14 TaxID=1802748 RepID=A0A1G2TJ72_9BACT|nr:MAG: hypothetical protein A2829_01630 [Candidatus Zambryskibacteria bacterium RIFCSPHIGHO2_01_FULL_43_60]OHA96661.1 MAG: hypothetical protein A3C70_02035 [Candidatus Zambryskibacteria bacterium RIFCSPHIGHO2_02_FULL_43_14]OHB03996.1 MAG: hypothetical protein A3B03_00870 [Candidatus Zambryskibacteria bacterium RIFCSPLOWO2_01_FULL_42_41]
MKLRNKAVFAVSALIIGGLASVAYADHSWGDYHWARTANPFTLELGDNVSSAWDSYLATTASDWSVSIVLDTLVKPGKTTSRTCRATNGRIEVCSAKYGFNGWLGIAQIWVSGNHIVKGITKMNDSYFNTRTYNTSAWRNLVMCQEIGHTLGLDHQDEIFDNPNLGTCMDYTNNPSTNQHPNQHDYDQLEAIYAHLDNVNTISSSNSVNRRQDVDLDNPSAWGKAIKKDKQGRNSLHVRDLDKGEKLFTFVVWAQ